MDSLSQNFKQVPLFTTSESINAQSKLAEYQKNMKIFIQAVEKQMAAIIDRYELKIKQLKQQIYRLRNQGGKKNLTATGFGLGLGLESQLSQCLSPIKHRHGSIAGMETARSNFLEQIPIKHFLQSDSKQLRTSAKMPNFDYKFEIAQSPERLNKSKFQVQTKKKKQRQQDLLHFLEMGKSNLQLNTDKMFNLIGKSRKDSKKDQQNEEVELQTPTKKRKGSEAHNTSLNSICQSLNNSFHGRRAQQKSQKKKKQLQTKQQEEARKQEQRQKFKKEQGIKNLLTTMRKNISTSLDKPVQVIKGSKLLTTGEKGKSVQLSTKAKVMINPVPVDLSQRNKQKQHNSVTTSPSKNPQSILKNSSTNILTKSIENISAISFYSSGEQ